MKYAKNSIALSLSVDYGYRNIDPVAVSSGGMTWLFSVSSNKRKHLSGFVEVRLFDSKILDCLRQMQQTALASVVGQLHTGG